jgi:uncharacterized protein (DUF1697 family)
MTKNGGTRQFVLVRGINVGKAKRIAMADLRSMLADLGHTEVATVLQSGNAIVTAPTKPPVTEKAIRAAIHETFGFDVAVLVRTAEELRGAIAADPFGDAAPDGSKHLLGFLSESPTTGAVDEVLQRHPDGNLRFEGGHLYLWCPDGVLKSPFATVDWRREIGVDVTMRNWNTMTRLAALA